MPQTWDERGNLITAPAAQTWDEHGNLISGGGDPLTQQTQATAAGAGVSSPGMAPVPLAPIQSQMQQQYQQHLQSLDPQQRMLAEHPEQRARMESGLSMAAPMAVMGLGTTSPLGTIAEKGLAGYVAPMVRAGLKSVAGSELGRYGGRAVGGIFGQGGAETGGEIGGALGAIGGPMVSGETFAKLPFGMGRFVATDEETAAARTAMKMAQRESDIKAGLRKPPFTPITQSPYYDEFAASRAEARKAATPRFLPSEGTGAPLPSTSDFYEQRGADLMKRTGDVETEGQQGGGYGASFPSSPTPEELLNRAMKEGKAAKLPSRIPRISSEGGVLGSIGGGEGDMPSTVARTKGSLVLTPEEARTRERMAPIWKQRASERGMIFAGGGVPEEGRSVPRIPTQTSVEEYGGKISPQSIIERSGGKFVGIQQGYGVRPDMVLFQPESGGTTLSLGLDELTPDAVREKMGGALGMIKPKL